MSLYNDALACKKNIINEIDSISDNVSKYLIATRRLEKVIYTMYNNSYGTEQSKKMKKEMRRALDKLDSCNFSIINHLESMDIKINSVVVSNNINEVRQFETK